ncbi:MAG: RnfABCDGE type electron transport complex subunit C [Eubacteriales bacterium]|nr:RnfABCDGE type electron transport complex subunit C [Eubacteriales bacterium]
MDRKRSVFAGGVHPTDGGDKAITSGKKIIPYIPDTVKVSMKQGLGPECTCVVKAGDQVTQGQLIGESAHFLSAAIHAPVTGKVLSVKDNFCEIKVESCELPDGSAACNQKWCDISSYSREDLIEKLRQGGLVGMGGAGFPTAAKYQTKDPITHLLINAAECEMFLTCDEHMMLEQGMAILNGVQILKKAAGAANAVICMEDNKPHCKESLEKLLKGHEDEIRIQVFPTRYPQGGEKQLIKAAMNVEIPSGKLPSSVGAIVSNVQTAKAAADMVLSGMPSTSRCITITGCVKNPANYLVPLGTNIGELVAKSGDVTERKNKIVLGGPMTGRCIGVKQNARGISEIRDARVSKVSGGLLVLKETNMVESNCIRCGSCDKACPIGLTPFKIDAAIRKGDLALCQSLQATECIACGCCSYVCPAKRELSHHTVQARDAVRAKLREEANRGK